ncbi:hypothetical protein P5G50_08960 [Leifsonia sp. F6_8S_P_1B]|uniref:Uncharacterized protein n=1 Tax=Leifsonia williamsii TaxID=3035919 RepID=A0ABT8KCU1_9MICO|nr:hypothetical protein [Leifsonia williamsii]MDN4614581.1 hypothetical protein [Leifsonia williamsii]
MHSRTTSYNHAHDVARRQLRRRELDLHWAKEQRRQQEQQLAAAGALVAATRGALIRKPVLVACLVLAADAGIAWGAAETSLLGSATLAVLVAVGVFALAVVAGLAVRVFALRKQRRAARDLLWVRDRRHQHTQFHIQESLGSYLEAKLLAHSTR